MSRSSLPVTSSSHAAVDPLADLTFPPHSFLFIYTIPLSYGAATAAVFCVQIYFVFTHRSAYTHNTLIKRIRVITTCVMYTHKTHRYCCGVYAGSMGFPWRRQRTRYNNNNNSNNYYYYTPTRCRKLDDIHTYIFHFIHGRTYTSYHFVSLYLVSFTRE